MHRPTARAGLSLTAVLALAMTLPAADTPPAGPKPLTFADALNWKNAGGATLSPDGQWFAYRLSADEGDGELVIRKTKGAAAEKRFPVGESRRGRSFEEIIAAGPGGFAAPMSFSDDSKWMMFAVNPPATRRPAGGTPPAGAAAAAARPQAKHTLLELATGKTTDFDKVRRFTFSPEGTGWLALHRNPEQAGPPAPDAATGTDLILRELATGTELNIGNVSDFAFDKKGEWLALVIDAGGQAGNGVQLRHLANGTQVTLDSGKASYRGLAWTEKGDALAVLKGVEDKAYEGKLYSVLGFTDLGKKPVKKVVYDHRSDPTFPAGMTVSPNRGPTWTENLDALVFGIHEVKKKPEPKPAERPGERPAERRPAPAISGGLSDDGFDYQAPPRGQTPRTQTPRPGAPTTGGAAEAEKPDLVIWHWQDTRLQSQQQVQASADRNFSYLCVYRIKEGKFLRLSDDSLRTVALAPKQRWAVGLDAKPYELASSLDGRRFQDVYVVDVQTGERRLALKKLRAFGASLSPSPAGTHAAYYDDGQYYLYDLASGRTTCLTGSAPARFVDEEDDHNVANPPTPLMGWTADGQSVLISDAWDVWQFPISGSQPVNLTGDGKRDGLRYRRRFVIDREEKGIDLTKPQYLSVYGEWTKKAGVAVLEPGQSGCRKLLWEDAAIGPVVKAKNGDTFVYARETAREAGEYYAADRNLAGGQKLTDVGAQQAKFAWSSGSRLVEYTGVNGKRLQGALYLPAGYEPGKRYPTVVYIYEKRSQGLNSYDVPRANGFSRSVYTSNGYAVLEPDIAYKVNDPGKSAVACVLPALEAAIATGVVDRERVGLHGHSWGGYQTAFLITQTDAFKAAVAGAPLTNLISMYSSVYWNSGSTNQPIFESSQGRFTAGYWDEPEAYTRNSPVYFARNVKTPLLLLHNDRDGAVDWNQGIEYYNTLRRLGKAVVMLQYKGENHGLLRPANQKDYARRMQEYFDHYLKGKPAPAWWTTGVPHLKIDDHLKERADAK